MKKVYVIMCVILLLFTSCSDGFSYKYDIKILGSTDSDIYKDKTKFIQNYMTTEKMKAENNVTVKLNNKLFNLEYEESVSYIMGTDHAYKTEDDSIKCRFNSTNGKLIQVYDKKGILKPEKDLITENDYKNWISELFGTFDIKDTSQYVYSCKSTVEVSRNNACWNDIHEYFYSDTKENERVVSYTFSYIRYVNGYPTTDKLEVYVYLVGGAIIIKFDREQFLLIDEFEIDDSNISKAVGEYIKNSINNKSYRLISFKVKYKYLTVIDEIPCCVYGVSLRLGSKNDNDCMFSELTDVVVSLK